jgi:hypothetical protein
MSEIPYTPLTGKIIKYFEKIREAAVPTQKVDASWMKMMGFGGGNVGYMLSVLRFIGFVDESKLPTELWRRYKDPRNSKVVMAEAIRKGYADLFNIYKDANRKDREALYAYFSSKTGKAKATVDLMITTFNNLCSLADFDASIPAPIGTTPVVSPILVATSGNGNQSQQLSSIASAKNTTPEVHINIQLHLPPASDPAVYENLFKAMKKYLLSAEE